MQLPFAENIVRSFCTAKSLHIIFSANVITLHFVCTERFYHSLSNDFVNSLNELGQMFQNIFSLILMSLCNKIDLLFLMVVQK